ncbi:MAG: hypothetical protein ACRDJC_24865 [Thermomicrobiales bacterium]
MMDFRRITGLFGGAVGALAVGTELAQAQDSSGGDISIGGSMDGLSESISGTVTNAVSGVATNSSASGGTSVERNELSLGEQEGVAIADASGGNNNLSFVS